MNFLTEKAHDLAPTGIFTLSDVLVWLGESRNSERNVLKRAVAAGEIIRIRRGLYCISSKVSHRGVSRNLLANLICGPSYVSMEAALSFHGWIPEAVHGMTSVGLSRPRSVVTPIGIFDYVQMRQTILLAGVERVSSQDASLSFLMAKPLKAVCDIVASRGYDWTDSDPLVESLRIDEENLESLKGSDFDELEGIYRSRKARIFLDGLRKDLGK